MSLPLANRLALVTGASRGIGYAAARALAKAGAHIVAVARTQGGLEELDDEIRKDGGSATLVPLSLTDTDGIARLGAALHERHGKLDILLAMPVSRPLFAARAYRPEAVVRRDGGQRDRQFSAHPLHAAAASPIGRGSAVFITSGAASKAAAYVGPYAASKAAPETLARVWRTRPRPPLSASICSAPVQSAPACAPPCFPAKTR